MRKIKSFKDTKNQWRFRVIASNGEIILVSESYHSKRSRNVGINSVCRNSQIKERYERLIAKNGQFYFNLKASNGQVIGTSEMYNSVQSRDKGIESVMKNLEL